MDRLTLHNKLKMLCSNVYFQPPSNIGLVFPAVVYSIKTIKIRHANDAPYTFKTVYQIILISKNPEEAILYELLKLTGISFDTAYAKDHLYFNVLSIH